MEAIPRSYILVFVQVRKGSSAEVLLLSGNPKLKRAKPELRLMVEFYYPRENLLRPNRVRITSGSRESFIQPKEFVSLLRSARRIIMASDFQEELKSQVLAMFRDFGIKRAEILEVCKYCLVDGLITVLSEDNTFYASGNAMCRTCVRAELDRELGFRGTHISEEMKKQLWKILDRKKDLESIITILSPNFDPSKNADLTLFDTIEAGEKTKTMDLDELPIPVKLVQVLLDSGVVQLMPVQVAAIEAGLFKGENLLVLSSTTSGKTLIGELAALPKIFEGKKNGLFGSPSGSSQPKVFGIQKKV